MDNPLQKYADELDNPTPFVPPKISIYAGEKDEPELIESDIHKEAEEAMVDIVVLSPEEKPNG